MSSTSPALPTLLPTAPFLTDSYDPNIAGLMNPHRVRTPEQWVQTYEQMGAYWAFNYTLPHAQQCHAELTSGKCSDLFFNSGIVTSNPMRLAEAVRDLLVKLGHELPEELEQRPTRFVGCAMGAITFAHDAARISNEVPGWEDGCALTSFAEKTPDGRMCFKRSSPIGTDLVVACEDVLTTGDSLRKMLDAVHNTSAQLAPYVLALVNRTGNPLLDDLTIISLISKRANVWEPSTCPLCKAGSPRVRPKENWYRLTHPNE